MNKLVKVCRHNIVSVLVFTFIAISVCSCEDASCPSGLPAACSCGPLNVANQSLWTVRCSDLNENDPAFLRFVPVFAEALILQNITFASDPEPDSFALTSVDKNQPFLQMRYIQMENLNHLLNVPLHTLLCSFPNLETASLPNNSLRWITFNASCVPHLKVLDLQWNHVHYVLNHTLIELESVSELQLDLRYNPLVCDCNLASLISWLADGQAIVLRPDQLVCSDGYPEDVSGHSLLELDASQLRCQPDSAGSDFGPWASQNNFAYFLYGVLGFLVVVSLAVLAFGFYFNFPFFREVWKKQEKKTVMQRRRYKTLETPA